MSDDSIQGALHAKQHEVNQLKDSTVGFLELDLLPYIEAANESLSLDPPRIKHAAEQLDELNYIINKKLNELTSSN